MPPVNAWLKAQMELRIAELGGRMSLTPQHLDLLVKRIDLVEEGRGRSHYVATLEDGTKKKLRRVTTVLNKLDKSWLDRMNSADLEHCRQVGNEVHSACEDWLTGRYIGPGLSPEASNSFEMWRRFWADAENELQVLATELTVWNIAQEVAGTLDLLALHLPSGGLFLYDWKTSSDLYESYLYQLGAYATCLALLLPSNQRINRASVVCIPRTGSAYTEHVLWKNWTTQGSFFSYAWLSLVGAQTFLALAKKHVEHCPEPAFVDEDPDEIWESIWRKGVVAK